MILPNNMYCISVWGSCSIDLFEDIEKLQFKAQTAGVYIGFRSMRSVASLSRCYPPAVCRQVPCLKGISFALFGVIVFVINATSEFKPINVEVTNQVNMSVSQGVKCCL